MKKLDSALGLQVLLVKQQAYGFNAQTKRFTDSRGLAWDVKTWMISQYPLRARHVEESLDPEGRVVRIWTEVHDKKSERLLSISVLGEPFASVALTKTLDTFSEKNIQTENKSDDTSDLTQEFDLQAPTDSQLKQESYEPKENTISSEPDSKLPHISEATPSAGDPPFDLNQGGTEKNTNNPSGPQLTDAALKISTNSFRINQLAAWDKRKYSKNLGHVRVAFFQWEQEISYSHPMVEVTPKGWPLSATCKSKVLKELRHLINTPYAALINATDSGGLYHLWTHKSTSLPSWAEHRRRRLLLNMVNACESFGVDLLILPEYSVRAETVKWLREKCLPGRTVAVLAGTYLEFDADSVTPEKSASLNLLWPVPDGIGDYLKVLDSPKNVNSMSLEDEIDKGIVLQWSRPKKYRSVALNEFIRPGSDHLAPLFVPAGILSELRRIGLDLDADGVVKLLASTPLPLANFMELICSEIFLFTSPTNIPEMGRDYVSMCARFGLGADESEVWKDLERLSKWLSVCPIRIGSDSRRSILIVPAATTRTADYWIAGQAGLLAAGTTTIFVNGAGSGLKGGSCFIGRESWKSGAAAHGYIEALTPYHGWSKGIYYNSKGDPLSENDQALVIADIDPHNMLEGKPRPQMLPVPLQLVAYLPVVETVDYKTLDQSLCTAIPVTKGLITPSLGKSEVIGKLKNRIEFWQQVALSGNSITYNFFESFSKNFSDQKSIQERAKSFFNNGHQQPFSSVITKNLLSSPALYDWIEVDMTLREDESLPLISVPSWTK